MQLQVFFLGERYALKVGYGVYPAHIYAVLTEHTLIEWRVGGKIVQRHAQASALEILYFRNCAEFYVGGGMCHFRISFSQFRKSFFQAIASAVVFSGVAPNPWPPVRYCT